MSFEIINNYEIKLLLTGKYKEKEKKTVNCICSLSYSVLVLCTINLATEHNDTGT